MKTEILDFTADALKEIIEIENDSFKNPWSEDSYRNELTNPNAVYKVIKKEGAVVAYGGFWQIFDEAHITNVAVKRSERKQGFGKMLMDALIKEAKERKIYSMTLEVRVSNNGARTLYEKCGFKNAGVRPKYYPDGEDAVIYWLEEI